MQYENRQNRPQQGHRQDQGAGSSQPSINLRNISFRRPLDPELFNSAASYSCPGCFASRSRGKIKKCVNE